MCGAGLLAHPEPAEVPASTALTSSTQGAGGGNLVDLRSEPLGVGVLMPVNQPSAWMQGVAGARHNCHPPSPLPTSRWGGLWAQPVRCLQRTTPAPHVGPWLPFSWHVWRRPLCSFHRFGGCALHILRWKWLSLVPTATPPGFPTRRCTPANGAHMCGDADGDGPGCQECGGRPPWARWPLRGALREPTGKAESSSP